MRVRLSFKTYYISGIFDITNNNNVWIEEDDKEEDEAKEEDEEEMEAKEDEEMEVEGNEEENDAEITHPYEEANPLNRKPPSPETAEQEFMNAPVGVQSKESVTLEEEIQRETRERVREEATGAGGPTAAPVARECTFTGFMKCGPTQFHSTKGVVRLCCWFKRMESTFGISECAKRRKVKFATATLHGRALTWWNSQVVTLGPKVANGKPWAEKVELYINGLPKVIKGETTSSRPTILNEAVRMTHTLMEQKIQEKNKIIAESNKRRWENNNQAAIRAERERVREEATRAGGPAAVPVARECTFTGFMKCGPTQFHSTKGVVRLCCWFKRMESTFGISECAKRRKVKFATATLHGRALTWWNSQVVTLGPKVANGKPWAEVKKIMIDEFFPIKEV
nr:hypothetical protein [Tanacetum cinerariifolium]